MRRREVISGFGALAVGGRPFWRATVRTQTDSISLVSYLGGGATPGIVAGVRFVNSEVARAATRLARSVSPPYLFNHVVRTFLFGSLIGRAMGQKYDEEVLFLACVLHDLGLTSKFQGDLPFEIQGAEAAKRFLQGQGYDGSKVERVWDGIAMHPSLIGQFKGPEISLVGAGAGADVLGPDSSQVTKAELREILYAYPRLHFSEAFTKTCADVVKNHPNGASHSFMRDIGERYVPGYRPRNFCDLISEKPFSDEP